MNYDNSIKKNRDGRIELTLSAPDINLYLAMSSLLLNEVRFNYPNPHYRGMRRSRRFLRLTLRTWLSLTNKQRPPSPKRLLHTTKQHSSTNLMKWKRTLTNGSSRGFTEHSQLILSLYSA